MASILLCFSSPEHHRINMLSGEKIEIRRRKGMSIKWLIRGVCRAQSLFLVFSLWEETPHGQFLHVCVWMLPIMCAIISLGVSESVVPSRWPWGCRCVIPSGVLRPQLEAVSGEILLQVNPSYDCELVPFIRVLLDSFVHLQCVCACVHSFIHLFTHWRGN